MHDEKIIMETNLLKVKRFKKLLKNTLYNSAAQAIIKLFETPHASLKVFLFICVIIPTGLCSFLIIKLVLNYLNYDVFTTLRTFYATPALFPKITVCNVNSFTTQYAAQFLKQINQELYPNVDIFNVEQMRKLNFRSKIEYINTIKSSARYKMNSLNKTEKKKLSHSLEDMMFTCYFNQQKCTVKDFNWYFDPYYGNCWIFNSGINETTGRKMSLLSNSFPGELYGLRMDFYVHFYEKLYQINSYSGGLGALIRIDNSSYLKSNYPRDGIKIEPGHVTSISLSRSFKTSLPRPYSNCLIDNKTNEAFESELFNLILNSAYIYTQPTCFLLCMQRAIFLKCECTDPAFLSLFYNASQCLTENQIACMENLYEKKLYKNEFVQENCFNECPLECYLDQFEASLSSYELMPSFYTDYLNTNSNLLEDFLSNKTCQDEVVRKSFVYFRIFYSVLSYEMSTEYPQTDLIWLFIGIASNLGILLGLNVFSIFEPVIVLIEICFMKFSKPKNRENV
jgi:hypothetical protein